MQDRNGAVVDRREMLRVKLKSLAEEARIIRREELRSRGQIREELYRHRMDVVRPEARATHVAYRLLRRSAVLGDAFEERAELAGMGEAADVLERSPALRKKVDEMLRRYGPKRPALAKAA